MNEERCVFVVDLINTSHFNSCVVIFATSFNTFLSECLPLGFFTLRAESYESSFGLLCYISSVNEVSQLVYQKRCIR